jgi:tether containing UBX domain for GLUT4
MASHVVVIATDLRRATIKVTPGTQLVDVLQEACKKLSLPSDKYLLKYAEAPCYIPFMTRLMSVRNGKKQVDLSNTFRLSGLTGGAKLELVLKSKTPSIVTVALQLPDEISGSIPNSRIIDKFPSDFTIWKIFRQFESGPSSAGRNLNITARGLPRTSGGAQSGSGQIYYATPVLNIMGKELATFADFQKTLSQLGYNSGNVLVRLTFRPTDTTLYTAMDEISQFFKDSEAEEEKLSAETKPQNMAEVNTEVPMEAVVEQQPSQYETQEQPSKVASDEPQEAQEPPLVAQETMAQKEEATAGGAMDVDIDDTSDPLRPVAVFSAPENSTPAAATDREPDSSYMPTVAHAQSHQAILQRSSQNKRLKSDRELEEQAAAKESKLAAVRDILVRVRFPDNTSADWKFGPESTGAELYKGVRGVMANPEYTFQLLIPGERFAIKDDTAPGNRLIRAHRLTGAGVVVNLRWDDGVAPEIRKQPFLKTSIAEAAKPVTVPEIPDVPDDENHGASASRPSTTDKIVENLDKVGKKMPKWLKMGKK